MNKIVAYFIKYPIAGNTLMVLIFGFGVAGMLSLNSTFFPPVDSEIISIQAVYPGASPEEVEEGIITKIEDELKGLTGIDRVSSVSRENSGTITIEIDKDYDIDVTVQDVKNAVDRINSFPADMEPLVVYKLESLDFAISFALSGKVDLKTLKKFGRDVENDLRAVDGISKVELSGFPEEEIEIAFREDDLRAYQLTFAQAAGAIQKANLELTGGTIKGEKEELLVRADSKGYFADDFKNIVIKTTPDGKLVHLSDVADVIDQWADDPNRSYLNGEPSVVVTIQNTNAEDILFITEYTRNYLEEYNAKNDIVKATIVRDGSISLRDRIDLLVENGIIGVALVLVVLAIFLNPSLAFWVAMALPICFAGMFILASFYGLTINVVSLFGMILVIGILVDDGIVIAENIYQHYERGESPNVAAINGTLEVLPAVTSAVLTTIIAFSAFFFLDGRIGEFFSSMGFVVMATLFFSLVEGVFILPAHVAHSPALKRRSPDTSIILADENGNGQKPSKRPFRVGGQNIVEKTFTNLMAWMRDTLYAPVLKFSLDNKLFALSVFVALFIITFGAIQGGIIRFTFFPPIERDNISINLALPAGTNEKITQEWIDKIEKAVWEVNGDYSAKRTDGKELVQRIQKKIGPSSYEATLSVNLLPGDERGVQSFDIANAISDVVGEVPVAEKLEYSVASVFGKPVSVSLLGYDKKELEQAREELKAEMKKLASLKDVIDSDQDGLREVNIILKPKAEQLGLQVRDIVGQVRQGFFGFEVQRLQRGLDEVKVWVRYKKSDRSSIGDLENMRIRLDNGREFPLKDLASVSIERGIIAINHLDGKREVRIEADLASIKESASEATATIQSEILPAILAKYPSVEPSFEGQSRQSAKTAESGQAVMPIILILMAAVIVYTFRSVWQMVVVYSCIPFGFIGVAWGHYLHGMQINIFSFLGIIALIGVMVNDSLVLVTAMNNLLKKGYDFMTALFEAGKSRFRPIILTSITTIAGLAPLILETSFQAQFLIPMAISLAYGLFIATFTTLILLPVFLGLLNDARVYTTWFWKGKKPSREVIEPAVKELKAEGQYHKNQLPTQEDEPELIEQ